MKYRKKPVVIEAIQYDGTEKCFDQCLKFFRDGGSKKDIGVSLEGIDIPTLEGTMLCSPNDWIIKGIKGEFYPCKPDIFEATYELVG